MPHTVPTHYIPTPVKLGSVGKGTLHESVGVRRYLQSILISDIIILVVKFYRFYKESVARQ